VEYLRPDIANGNVLLRTSARISTRKYELLEAQLAFPRLADGAAFLDVYGVYRNYPSLNYYGPGPRSAKQDRSDYRLEDASVDATGGIKPTRHLRLGATAGYLRVNIGAGDDERYNSTDRLFTPAQVPGLDNQSTFLRAGTFIQYDYRDRPSDPHYGGNYEASYTFYNDVTLNTGDHRKLNAEAQQYFPFLNEKRVIALRGKTELSYRNTDQLVPFYLQPILGGSEDLRGFRPFRFYDDNLLTMTAEYRWEVMSGFDMAVFTDAGKVFHRHAELNFADLETSSGFGLRFKSRDAVVMRWDVGFSREGFQVWIKFHNVF
jgi:outer membrane protein assembly factor BamA